jgi:uncharacterized protein involved in outer membrane biogenesis
VHRPTGRSRWRKCAIAAGTVILALSGVFTFCESQGWPFLARPLQDLFKRYTGRELALVAPTTSTASDTHNFQLHFFGGIELQTKWLQIASAPWSQDPYLVAAKDVELRLRYSDLWHAYRGGTLILRSLSASTLEAYLQRLSDGRASWQISDVQSASPAALPQIESLSLQVGQLHYDDTPLGLSMRARLALASAAAPGPSATASAPPHADSRDHQVLSVEATGHYAQNAFRLNLVSSGALPWEVRAGVDSGNGVHSTVSIQATVGHASLDFDGSAEDLLHLQGLNGKYTLQGPSLAAVGEPLGLTLPTTGAFGLRGTLLRAGSVWTTDVQHADIGNSRLDGHFVLDTAQVVPRLTGRLGGKLLALKDLGPAVGVQAQSDGNQSHVLPARPFNLAALRAMNADIDVAIDSLDLNTRFLEPLRPLSAQLQLTNGVLTLKDIDARTGQGHLRGTVALDGNRDRALWVAALRWDAVQLGQWIRQTRRAGMPAYLSGELRGHANLHGEGRSTAEILGSLQGDLGTAVHNGRVSHLLIEAGGLDIAEAFGVLVSGDDALRLDCANIDLQIVAGAVTPRLAVFDTADSTVWADGTLSLRTEMLDLRAVVAPKDFSPLTLRSPLHVTGTFAKPLVSVEKGPLGVKLGSALLLALINPLAGLIPLLDTGNKYAAQRHAAECRDLMGYKLRSVQRGLSGLPIR